VLHRPLVHTLFLGFALLLIVPAPAWARCGLLPDCAGHQQCVVGLCIPKKVLEPFKEIGKAPVAAAQLGAELEKRVQVRLPAPNCNERAQCATGQRCVAHFCVAEGALITAEQAVASADVAVRAAYSGAESELINNLDQLRGKVESARKKAAATAALARTLTAAEQAEIKRRAEAELSRQQVFLTRLRQNAQVLFAENPLLLRRLTSGALEGRSYPGLGADLKTVAVRLELNSLTDNAVGPTSPAAGLENLFPGSLVFGASLGAGIVGAVEASVGYRLNLGNTGKFYGVRPFMTIGGAGGVLEGASVGVFVGWEPGDINAAGGAGVGILVGGTVIVGGSFALEYSADLTAPSLASSLSPLPGMAVEADIGVGLAAGVNVEAAATAGYEFASDEILNASDTSAEFIKNGLDGWCLDVPGVDNGVVGTAVTVFEKCIPGREDHHWAIRYRSDKYVQLVNQLNQTCLGVVGFDSHTNGARAEIYHCSPDGNDGGLDGQWELVARDGKHEIRNRVSGKCLDVAGSDEHGADAPVQVWDCGGPKRQDQLWTIGALATLTTGKVDVRPSTVIPAQARLRILRGVTGTGQYLSVPTGGTARLAAASDAGAIWKFVALADGTYAIQPATGATFLSTTSDGTKVDLYTTDDGSGRQRWRLVPRGDGTYTLEISGGAGERKYLSASSDGSRVDLWTSDDDSGRQRWLFD
jgi:hypothetical protein